MIRNPRDLKKPNNVEILNEFFKCEMRFLAMQIEDHELGPIRYVTDIETEERMLFVTHSPEVYNGQEK